MQKTSPPEIVYCTECQREISWEALTRHQKTKYRGCGRVYCSQECSKEYCRKISSKTMTETNKKYASERMKKNNPMKDPHVREKMSRTLKEIGHKPKIRGGNGHLTVPQVKLLKELSKLNPVAEYCVLTHGFRCGYPPHYKIDIAIPDKKIAIEIDGGSHYSLSIKEKDIKKEKLLKRYGWTVLRFWNKEIMEDLERCVQTVMSTISK